MRLLDRYLLREFVVPLSYCLGGFLIFWMTSDLFAELNRFQKNNLRFPDILEYYCVKVPDLLIVVIPIALLLAMLYALTNHARHNEITAMRAAGISLWRISFPYFLVGVASSFLLFFLNEYAVSNSLEKADKIINRYNAADQGQSKNLFKTVTFLNESARRNWFIGVYNTETTEMLKPSIRWIRADGAQCEISAEKGYWTNNAWLFINVQHAVTENKNEPFPKTTQHQSMIMDELNETPRFIHSEIKISRLDTLKSARRTQLTISEIEEYLELHPNLDDIRRDLLLTKLHGRIAMPWTCIVVVLITMPFGAVSSRRNAFVGVASSVFICIIFFFLREFSQALGGGGHIPPWIAAWLPNILFGSVGLIMIHRSR